MKLHVLLVLTALAATRAASITKQANVKDIEKKLTEVVKEVLKEDIPIQKIDIDEVNKVEDVDNKLKKISESPVNSVIVDKKDYGIEKGSSDVIPASSENVKRAEVDLKNPGPPQVQEHDTQSPEDINPEQAAITMIKDNFEKVQNMRQNIGQQIQQFLSNNGQWQQIQTNMQNFQTSFTNQFSELNNSVQGLLSGNSESSIGGTEPIKNDHVDFEPEKETLKSTMKQQTTDTSAAAAAGPFSQITQYLQTMQQNFQTSMQNLTASFQNYLGQLQQGGANSTAIGPGSIVQNFGGVQTIFGQQNNQSDETQTNRPGIWQGISSSLQNLWNRPGQNQQPQQVQADQPTQAAAPSGGPIVQAFQGVVNLIRPTTPPQVIPVESGEANKPQEQSEGANVVPEKPSEAQKKPDIPTNPGPIQQIVQRNPIVQGITGTVQRIQSTIGNPEKPREVEKAGYGSFGHRPIPAATGVDNNDSGVVSEKKKDVIAKEPIAEQKEKESDKKETINMESDKKEDAEKTSEAAPATETDSAIKA